MPALRFASYLLAVALVVLKLLGQIDLSWWLVTMPVWFWPALGYSLQCLGALFLWWAERGLTPDEKALVRLRRKLNIPT